MQTTLIVLAVVFIAIEKVSGVNNDVGTGSKKVMNCIKMTGMKSMRLFMMGMSPQCDENGQLKPLQCFQHTDHCMCVRQDGGMINYPSKGLKGCQCMVSKDEGEKSGLIGSYIPQCNPDGSYQKKQCHYSTGYCFCADPTTGKNTTVPAREDVNCD